MQQAAACLGLHGVHVSGRADRVRRRRSRSSPTQASRRRRLHHRPLRLRRNIMVSDDTIKSYDRSSPSSIRTPPRLYGRPRRKVSSPTSFEAVAKRDVTLAAEVIERRRQGRGSMRKPNRRWRAIPCARRQPMAGDLRHIIDGAQDRRAISSDRRSREEHRQARVWGTSGESHPRPLMARHKAHGRVSRIASSTTCSTRSAPRRRQRRWRCGQENASLDALYNSVVPRTADVHDGRSAQHRPVQRTCCSAPRTSSGSATTPPISPKTYYYLVHGTQLTDDRPKNDETSSVLISKPAS